ncbi:hypothetical protein CYMTET_51251 [Cymbomonas tetramitiformis]|uniref:Uncharacterized protein n=1 Tax=Cymbomonas tetramitiformis TaxID=36881 RepID=A0AAE0ESU7_9CHLO|nr:hypothetical protein CYMTET_51251 [Cymbomonas tetramitiformis]
MPGPVYSQQAGRVRGARGLKLGRRHVPHLRLRVSYYTQKAKPAAQTPHQPKLEQGNKGAALQDATVGNYRPKAEASMQFCVAEGRSWLLAAEAKVRLYIIYLMSTGTIKAASSQPYLSAINNHHEDMGRPGPAKGWSVSRPVKWISSLQVQQASGEAFVTFGRPDTGVSMLKEHISVSGELVSAALHEGDSKRHVRLKRVQGMVQLLQHWEQAWDDLWLQGGSAEDSARHSS